MTEARVTFLRGHESVNVAGASSEQLRYEAAPGTGPAAGRPSPRP